MNPANTTTAGAAEEAVRPTVEERSENVLYVDVRLIYIVGLIGSVLILLSHNVDNQIDMVLAFVSVVYLFVHKSYVHRRPEEREAERRLAENTVRIIEDERFVVVPKRVVAFICFLLLVYLVFTKFHFFGFRIFWRLWPSSSNSN